MRKRVVAFVMILSATLAALAQEVPATHRVPALPHLASWMAGSFSSAEQAAADSNYFDIRLHMEPIWEERADGPWLYVEQAVAQSQDRPYRQRVYRLRPLAAGEFVSEVWELPDPVERFAGAWAADSLLVGITPDSLRERRGCAVRLRWDEAAGAFAGGTLGEDCASNLRGAAYATSQVLVTAAGLDTWDRGWDDHGLQVWGAREGGYRFRRDAPLPAAEPQPRR